MPKGNLIPRSASQKLQKFMIRVPGGSFVMEHLFLFGMMTRLGTDHSENSFTVPFMLMKLHSKSGTHRHPRNLELDNFFLFASFPCPKHNQCHPEAVLLHFGRPTHMELLPKWTIQPQFNLLDCSKFPSNLDPPILVLVLENSHHP